MQASVTSSSEYGSGMTVIFVTIIVGAKVRLEPAWPWSLDELGEYSEKGVDLSFLLFIFTIPHRYDNV